MKKVAVIILTLALAIGMVLPASAVSASDGDKGPIVIHKVILDGGPAETFRFHVYRDHVPWGSIGPEDNYAGFVDITGEGTEEIYVPYYGLHIIHEELSPGSAYQQPADQTVGVDSCGRVEVTFTNKPGEVPERGQLEILKVDEAGAALAGAEFLITPNPKTGSDSLILIDNGLNDEDATDGVLLVTGCIIGTVCEVKETKAPDGYDLAPPQTVTISATVTLTFQNFPEDGDATRTPGFWMTHCDFTQHVFFEHLGGSINLGWRVLDSPADVFGMFWANTAYEYNSDGSKRSKLCQAKVIASFQLTAAILNTGLDNGAPVPIDPVTGLDLITAMQNALSGNSRGQILRLKNLLDTYNNSGTDVDIVDNDGYPVLPADPECARELADVTIADCD